MSIAQMTISVCDQSPMINNFPQPPGTHFVMGPLIGAATFALLGLLTSAMVMVSHSTIVMAESETSFCSQGRETPSLQQILGK